MNYRCLKERIRKDLTSSFYITDLIKLRLKTVPSEIGFPVTFTSSAFLNQKPNKQTSHE